MADIWTPISLRENELRLDILPGLGGRLWDVVFQGGSLLFANADLVGREVDPDNLTGLPTRSPQFGFPLWGGEKTWIAPDSAWKDAAPYPALDSAPYEVVSRDERHVHVTSAPCPQSGLQVDRLIRLRTGDRFSVRHRVTNCGAAPRFTGIWSVLMINRPARIGLVIGPDSDVIPVFGDAAGRFETQGAVAVFDCTRAQEYKLGTCNPTGRAFVRFDTGATPIWLLCETPAVHPGDRFAHGHNFEVFNSGDYPYGEAEWHAPAKDLDPGDSLEFTQAFSVRTEASMVSGGTFTQQEQELASCMSS